MFVIPAEAGLSTAELVIHLDLIKSGEWIPASAGMTTNENFIPSAALKAPDRAVGAVPI